MHCRADDEGGGRDPHLPLGWAPRSVDVSNEVILAPVYVFSATKRAYMTKQVVHQRKELGSAGAQREKLCCYPTCWVEAQLWEQVH